MNVSMEALLVWCLSNIKCDLCRTVPAKLRFTREGKALFVCPADEALLTEVAPIDQEPLFPSGGDDTPTV